MKKLILVDADSFLRESISVFHFRVESVFKCFSGEYEK